MESMKFRNFLIAILKFPFKILEGIGKHILLQLLTLAIILILIFYFPEFLKFISKKVFEFWRSQK